MCRATLVSLLLFLGLCGCRARFAVEPPDGAAAVDVRAEAPGFAPEEVERQVTLPLEAALAGTPGIAHIRSESSTAEAVLRLKFRPDADPVRTRQEVGRRVRPDLTALPPGVVPRLTDVAASYQFVRYLLRSPKDASGKNVYTSGDLRSLQDSVIAPALRHVAGVADVRSAGGAVKVYEIRPDPERLRRYDISLQRFLEAVNATKVPAAGRGKQGHDEEALRASCTLRDPSEAASRLRTEELRRVREMRALVVATLNNVPVTIGDLVEGGPQAASEVREGVVPSGRSPAERIGLGQADEPDADDLVEGSVQVRPGEDAKRTLGALQGQIRDLNETPGKLLPGIRIEALYTRSEPGEGDNNIIWIRGSFPANATLEEVSAVAERVRALLLHHPSIREVVTYACAAGGATAAGHDAGPAAARLDALVRLRPAKPGANPRHRREVAEGLLSELEKTIPGPAWGAGPDFRDGLSDDFTAGPGEGLLKIRGPDLEVLERLATNAAARLNDSEGVRAARIAHIFGRPKLGFQIDRAKCAKWGVAPADVSCVLGAALGATEPTGPTEGKPSSDVAVRWPRRLRDSEAAILDIPVDIAESRPVDGRGAAAGNSAPRPASPRLRLRDLVSPAGDGGTADADRQLLRAGAAVIYREDGQRLVAIHFSLRGKNSAAAFAAARERLAPLFKAPYAGEWSRGEW